MHAYDLAGFPELHAVDDVLAEAYRSSQDRHDLRPGELSDEPYEHVARFREIRGDLPCGLR